MSRHSRVAAAVAVLVLGVLFYVAPLSAQTASPDTAANGATPVAAPLAAAPSVVVEHAPLLIPASAPGWTNTASTARASTVVRPSAVMISSEGSRNPALMIVGGVGLLAGAVIGGQSGTIIMIGGAVVGLYGLWNYLQ